MIRAQHTFSGKIVAGLFAGPLLGRAFREIRVLGEVEDAGLPILMLANHFCWWDGFIQCRLNNALFRRRLYVMMLEEQLERHPLLARCGCFSIRKRSRSILESLDYCREVMRSPENMLLLFPQGELQSIHVEAPGFQSGIHYLCDRIAGDHAILLDVNLPDYGAKRRPSLNCYLKMLPGRETERERLRMEWNRFYAACKIRQTATR